MKRILPLLLALALLAGCGGREERTETDWTPLQLADALAQSQAGLPELYAALPGDAAYDETLRSLYGLNAADVADGAVLAAGGTEAAEFAVLHLREDADAAEVVRLMKDYVNRRLSSFIGYFPEQEALLRDARVLRRGSWAVLTVCPDPDRAEAAFTNCFSAEAPDTTPEYRKELIQPTPEPTPEPTPAPEPTPEPWSYDHDRLVAAWESGDRSTLDEMDRTILERIEDILDEVSVSGQTLPELELAIHDWIVEHVAYDTATIERYGGTPDPDDDNPYGALVNGLAICKGYTSSFQLLMDLVGIECISVDGSADNGLEIGEHAWNLVRLDGDWYAVDVTWDDPLSSRPLSAEYHHRYFNVTSNKLRSNHFWDASQVPEATGTYWTWAVVARR